MHTEALMNWVGAPDKLWYQCSQYLTQVHNITAKESIKWKTPVENRHGHTPDISAYLMFLFYEKVYYLDNEEKYPHTKEKKGRFLGVADSVGDALTFTVLTEESKILTRSVVRSAVNPTKYGYENKCLMSKEDQRQQKAAENAREAENTANYLPPTPPFDDPLRAFLHDQLKGRFNGTSDDGRSDDYAKSEGASTDVNSSGLHKELAKKTGNTKQTDVEDTVNKERQPNVRSKVEDVEEMEVELS